MNTKTVAIVAGASATSLAAGGAAGYLIAKRKFDATVESRIAFEVEKTKKYFSILLQEAREGNAKPASPADIPIDDEEDVEEQEEELTEDDLRVIEKGRERLADASRALVDYSGFADKPALEDVVEKHNIFTESENGTAPKKATPKRGPGGKFVKKSASAKATPEQTPYIITQEDFLLNDGEYEQRNLLYFKQDDTIIDLENNDEVVSNAVIGEVNLTLFPAPEEGEEGSTICVRNDALETDYEVRLMEQGLTEYMGLGENEGFDETDAAEHRIAREDEDDEEEDEDYGVDVDNRAEHYV